MHESGWPPSALRVPLAEDAVRAVCLSQHTAARPLGRALQDALAHLPPGSLSFTTTRVQFLDGVVCSCTK
jgi:hypothetical protein